MPNDIKKLKRLMYAANHLKKENPVILKGRKITSSQALKYAWWFESFRAKLASGVYRFSYFKIDGGIREAVGTLDPTQIPEEKRPKAYTTEEHEEYLYYSTFCYYDLYADGDAGGWRSFRIDNFIGFVEKVNV